MRNSTSRPTIELNANMLGSGVLLLCVGGFIGLAGLVLSGVALTQAAKKWIEQMDESPTEMAQRRMQQLKVAAAAGSKAWREQSR